MIETRLGRRLRDVNVDCGRTDLTTCSENSTYSCQVVTFASRCYCLASVFLASFDTVPCRKVESSPKERKKKKKNRWVSYSLVLDPVRTFKEFVPFREMNRFSLTQLSQLLVHPVPRLGNSVSNENEKKKTCPLESKQAGKQARESARDQLEFRSRRSLVETNARCGWSERAREDKLFTRWVLLISS